MHLGVEASRMAEDWRGIGRYTRQLLRHFASLRPDLRVTLFADAKPDEAIQLKAELAGMGYEPGRGALAPLRALQTDPPELAWYPWNKTKYFSRAPRMVVTIHDLVPFHFRYRSWFKQGVQRKIERRFRQTAERADLILTDSVHAGADIVRQLGVPQAKVMVIPLAADDFDPGTGAPDLNRLSRFGLKPVPFFLYVGANEERKNLGRLRQAFGQLRAEGFDAELVICGPEAPGNGVEPGVRWVGRVSEAELRVLYRAARAFVFPSLYEGFGLPVLEAMACGTPVICSRATSLPEVAGDAALYFDPLDVPALTGAMIRCQTDPGLRADLSARSLHQASRFRWAETARQTLAAFDGIRPPQS
ncbi:MAG: glycosyltransferase family 1 protein [Gemmatimonadota bacterium]